MNRVGNSLVASIGAVVFLVALSAINAATAYAQSCTPPPADMVSWWPADGDANDVVDANHGTLWNGATFAPGMVGPAFSLDGTDDYVEIPDSATSLPPQSRLTHGSTRTRSAGFGPSLASTTPTIRT